MVRDLAGPMGYSRRQDTFRRLYNKHLHQRGKGYSFTIGLAWAAWQSLARFGVPEPVIHVNTWEIELIWRGYVFADVAVYFHYNADAAVFIRRNNKLLKSGYEWAASLDWENLAAVILEGGELSIKNVVN